MNKVDVLCTGALISSNLYVYSTAESFSCIATKIVSVSVTVIVEIVINISSDDIIII